MRASRHYNLARRAGIAASHCEGFVRRLYVRPGGWGHMAAVGWYCDGCAMIWLDQPEDVRPRIDAAMQSHRKRAAKRAAGAAGPDSAAAVGIDRPKGQSGARKTAPRRRR